MIKIGWERDWIRPQPIRSKEEAEYIGKQMAKKVSKKLKLKLSVNEKE